MYALPRKVALPVAATAVASVGFSLTPLLSSGLPRFFGFTGVGIAAILMVAAVEGVRGGMLATALTMLAADYFFLGPPYEFGLTKPCHYVALATLAGASAAGSLLIGVRRSVRAAQLAQPIGLALPDSSDVLICQSCDRGIKTVHVVRDI